MHHSLHGCKLYPKFQSKQFTFGIMSIMNFCPPNQGSTVNKNHIYQFHVWQDSFNWCVGLDANTDCNEKY